MVLVGISALRVGMTPTEVIEEQQIKNEAFPIHIKGFTFVME